MAAMIAPSLANAREVQVVDPGASYVEFDSVGNGPAFLAAARRRVLMLSMILAFWAVIHFLGESALDAAELSSLLKQVKEAGAPQVDMVSLMLSSGQSTGMMVLVSIVVSTCGLCGAKQSQQRALTCFSCCNLVSGCCSCMGTALFFFFMAVASMASSQVQLFMEDCDPWKCMPVSVQEFTPSGNYSCAIDCLAAGTWEDYTAQCGGHKVPLQCPKFLMCKGRRNNWEYESEERSPFLPPPRPMNPRRSCTPRYDDMRDFHRASEALPKVWPALQMMVAYKAAFAAISTVLMCLGAKWGWELHQELAVQCLQPQQALQPATATVAAVPFAEGGNLERSLVLHAPPSPLTL